MTCRYATGGERLPLDGRRSEPAMVYGERRRPRRQRERHQRASGIARIAEPHVGEAAAASDAPIDSLRYFRATAGSIAGVPVDITRTGYTGDLGYEVWMPWDAAITVWDAIVDAGTAFDLHPAGMLALDVARIEAGLLLIEVDFSAAAKALVEAQKYSPFELGLGRLVDLAKGPFVGRAALNAEYRRGPRRRIVGLEVDWTEVETLCEAVGLPPTAPATASRVAVPVCRTASTSAGDLDDVVDDVEEADCTGDRRRAALRGARLSSRSLSKP